MAMCECCNLQMTIADSCCVGDVHRAGAAVALFPYGKDPGWEDLPQARCPDCGVRRGGLHHPGCEVQRCPGCRGQLISCDCDWDEFGADDDEDDDAIVLDVSAFRPAPLRTVALPPFATVVAPLRAQHRETLRRLAAWSLAHGRSCDLDIAALCLEVLDRPRKTMGRVLLDRPTVNQILWADVWNLSQQLGALLPAQWHMGLWNILEWLDGEDLLDPRSAPLAVLREPLRCSGELDETGQPLPTGMDTEIPCQCYIPYDPSLPSVLGQHVVGYDQETFEPLLVRAQLRPPSEPPSLADLEPLHILSRRLRLERSGIEIHAEEFTFVGVVAADTRTSRLWLYRHDATSRRGNDPLILDATGRAWLPRADRRFRLGYRWVAARDTVAVFRAGGTPANLDDAIPGP